MSKDAAAGAELYFAQTSITKKVDLNRICARISKYSTASRGDILLVLDGFITVMNESLADGESVHLGDFGSFRMVAGSKGATTEEEFKTSLFNRAHIVFYPGTMLMNLVRDASFEKWVLPGTTPPEGEDDRPVIE
ncbi:HU family DNA-binding protein [Parabacteroides sp. GYB001]|nr:HU family DNA-binding protein [Parabacteroides leei]